MLNANINSILTAHSLDIIFKNKKNFGVSACIKVNTSCLRQSRVLHSSDSISGPKSSSIQVFPLFFGDGLVQVLE